MGVFCFLRVWNRLTIFEFDISFSDPCLAGASDDSKDSGNGQNGRSSHSTKDADSTKMLSTILQQIAGLHETNSKICRSLHDNKGELAGFFFFLKFALIVLSRLFC